MQHVYKFLLLLKCNLRSKYFMIYKRFFTMVFILAWVLDHWSLITAQKPNKPNHWLLALKQAHKYAQKMVYFTQN